MRKKTQGVSVVLRSWRVSRQQEQEQEQEQEKEQEQEQEQGQGQEQEQAILYGSAWCQLLRLS